MLKLPLLAAALAAATLASAAASAATVAFSYDGVGEDTPDVVAHGSGTVTFAGTGALTLASVTAFRFGQTTTITDPSLAGSGTFSYGLADLTRFTAVYADGAFTSLSLTTRPVADPSGYLDDQAFAVSYRAGARGYSAFTRFDDGDTATEGAISFPAAAPVPEPASWAVLLAGLGATGAALRRRRGPAPARA